MLNTKLVATLLLSFYAVSAFAFKAEKCRRFVSRIGMYGFLSSTTSYVSSTGDCAMLGRVEDVKKVFIAVNHERMMEDIAVGYGSYIETYVQLSGCPKDMGDYYVEALREKYASIFGKDTRLSSEDLYNEVEEIIRTNALLRKNCVHQMVGYKSSKQRDKKEATL